MSEVDLIGGLRLCALCSCLLKYPGMAWAWLEGEGCQREVKGRIDRLIDQLDAAWSHNMLCFILPRWSCRRCRKVWGRNRKSRAATGVSKVR